MARDSVIIGQQGPISYTLGQHEKMLNYFRTTIDKELRYLGFTYIAPGMPAHQFFKLANSANRVFDLTYWAQSNKRPQGIIRLYCPGVELVICAEASSLLMEQVNSITETVEQQVALRNWEDVPVQLHRAVSQFHQIVA